MEAFGGMSVVLVLFLVVLAVLWICLPFALFGVKGRLDKIIKLREQRNRSL